MRDRGLDAFKAEHRHGAPGIETLEPPHDMRGQMRRAGDVAG